MMSNLMLRLKYEQIYISKTDVGHERWKNLLKSKSIVYNYCKVSDNYWLNLIYNVCQLHVYNLKIKQKMKILGVLSVDYKKKTNLAIDI